MRSYFYLIAFTLCTGCSLHPLQDDVTDLPLMAIVHKVRCEARDAIMRHDLAWVPNPKKPRERIYNFDAAAIAYNFTFSANEDNGVGADAGVSVPVHNGVFAVGFKAAESRSRKGDRVIKIADTFGDLRKLTTCDRAIFKESARYPITGTTGLDEVIASFVALAKGQEALSDVADYTDTVTFTTAVTGSVNPSINLIPAPKRLQTASLVLAAARQDVHKILVAITAPLTPAERARANEAKIVKVRIVDFVPPKEGLAAGKALVTVPTTSPAFDAKQRALQSLDRERAQRTQQDILDRLPPN